MNTPATVVLYRPVGQAELDLIRIGLEALSASVGFTADFLSSAHRGVCDSQSHETGTRKTRTHSLSAMSFVSGPEGIS